MKLKNVACGRRALPLARASHAWLAIALAVYAAMWPISSVAAQAQWKVWGTYKAPHLMMKREVEWTVVIVPAGAAQADLVTLAQALFKANPRRYYRIFDDESRVSEWVARDQYVNDKTGRIPFAAFPNGWAGQHFIGNIQNQSDQDATRWQLTNAGQRSLAILE